jgi:hypothetical protein
MLERTISTILATLKILATSTILVTFKGKLYPIARQSYLPVIRRSRVLNGI